jgi:hypothetical protein
MPPSIFGYTPENWKDFLTALAILVGGAWTFYQFALRKAFESALLIDLSADTMPAAGADKYVSLHVKLENKGQRRITLPPALTPEQITDYENSVAFPGDVQIKQVQTSAGPAFIGWWSRTRMSAVGGIPDHISLMYEYSRADGKIDYFMEPGEVYHFDLMFRLPPGAYAVKVVIVGKRASAAEFWSRILYFNVV